MTSGILAAIGHTRLVKLERLLPGAPFTLFAKLECLNPGGSMKDRAALHMLQLALDEGRIGPRTVVIESSSGNMGIGLAQVCRYHGLRFICVVDPRVTAQNLRLLGAYGAEVDIVPRPHPVTGEFLQARLDRVQQLLQLHPMAYWPNQYANEANAAAHHRTMEEIVSALDGRVDHLFCSTSTCGTLRGCAEYIAAHALQTRITAVDAVGSVIFGGRPAPRLIPGHGASVRPPLFRAGLAHDHVHATDRDCVAGCRALLRHEAILAGGSSGAVIWGLWQRRHRIAAGSTCVVILADRGDRYLDTVYADEWVMRQFGATPELPEERDQCVTAHS